MFVVTHETLANAHVLETRSLPKRYLGRVTLWPKREASRGFWLRLLFEMQILRFSGALMPFVIPMFIWPELALPIAQAPVVMVMVIAVVETKVLLLSVEKRKALLSDDEAARRLDLLTYRARAVLRGVAARHGKEEGALFLVVEQSEMARVIPLTLVSVQADMPDPHVLALDAQDRDDLRVALFDDALTERDLHMVNLREGKFVRDIRQEARAVSAQSRLAAWIDAADRAEAQPVPKAGPKKALT